MRFNQINEGIERGDLQSLVNNTVGVGLFEPKTGTLDEITVISFACKEEAAANDLSDFIEHGATGAVDTEVSPSTDEDNNYLVFVEVNNDEDLMKTTLKILADVERLSNIEEWTLDFYEGRELNIGSDDIKQWLKKNH